MCPKCSQVAHLQCSHYYAHGIPHLVIFSHTLGTLQVHLKETGTYTLALLYNVVWPMGHGKNIVRKCIIQPIIHGKTILSI